MLAPIASLAFATVYAKLISFFPDREFPANGQEEVVSYQGIDPKIPFSEVVPSWNVEPAAGATLEVRIRVHGPGYDSKWYTFGTWTLDDASRRASVKGQRDDDGNVDTDTFVPNKPVSSLDVEIHLNNDADGLRPRLKLFTLSFADTKHMIPSDDVPSAAWGKTIEVPQRAQGNYPNGGVLCSPTSLSMVLWHYANELHRPELNHDVPEVEAHVWDKVYDGAGNWPFNAAYAGSFAGMRGYIARLRGISDLEKWIQAGLPVICSISLDLAEGKATDQGTGHLVVLVGFTKDGDPVFNDPARRAQVRYTYTRANFERAWMFSRRTVYLVYPEGAAVPADPDGMWIGAPR
jgi:hypothetical protein